MTLIDVKGHLVARLGNYRADLREKQQTVILIEADLVRARREAAIVGGAVQATEQALSDVEQAMQEAGKPVAQAVSGPGN